MQVNGHQSAAVGVDHECFPAAPPKTSSEQSGSHIHLRLTTVESPCFAQAIDAVYVLAALWKVYDKESWSRFSFGRRKPFNSKTFRD